MLFGLVLAVGLVVDDAIVVLENAQRHIQMGKDKKEATIITMIEVTGAIVATTLVLMAVFVPVCFIPGINGQMFRQFAVCIACSSALLSAWLRHVPPRVPQRWQELSLSVLQEAILRKLQFFHQACRMHSHSCLEQG